ncbi:MAG: hypothetical protein PWP06_1668, partial [Candidatus Marinimicrobia bacterium]|nr:hypothetical protein [Candidatus Neomarinimicrobiota bacterium]
VTRDEIGWVRQWTMRAIKFPAFATECQLLTVDFRLSTFDFRLKSQERRDANFRQAAACPYIYQLLTSEKAAKQRLKTIDSKEGARDELSAL